jgi:hypothetical protein
MERGITSGGAWDYQRWSMGLPAVERGITSGGASDYQRWGVGLSAVERLQRQLPAVGGLGFLAGEGAWAVTGVRAGHGVAEVDFCCAELEGAVEDHFDCGSFC